VDSPDPVLLVVDLVEDSAAAFTAVDSAVIAKVDADLDLPVHGFNLS
jgi:hypothetical protein